MRTAFCLQSLALAALVLAAPLAAQSKTPAAPRPAPAPIAPPTAPPAINEDRFVDELLAQKAVDLAHAAWLTGRAAGAFEDTVTPTLAGAKALEAGWAAAPLTAASPLSWQTYSQVLVRAWKIPTGLVYGWFPTPRYAYRELVFRKIVPSGIDPEAPVSGEEAMRALQNLQDWKEAQK